MNTQKPHNSQEHTPRKLLEEKLKFHIQREFDLGEKVILLLHQKKQLEQNLQDQLKTQKGLKNELEEVIKSKKTLEQEFLRVQRELQEQQKVLRQRSRRMVETEEDSRENLEILRQKIRVLQDQLDVLDIQKTEEHVRLSNKLTELREKEHVLSQELQTITSQKDAVEGQLQKTQQQVKELATSYQIEKQEYERQIELLKSQQNGLKTQIELLLNEKRANEQKLRKEIESLRISKTRLEEQVEQLQQEKTEVSQEFDAELMGIIEKQGKRIREIKEKAHQRSTMLKVENETLRNEIKKMEQSQEQIVWENMMLEASLKELQNDLTEYIQLKKKFEEVQKEKEHFEEVLYKKIRFLETQEEESEQSQEKPPVLKPDQEEDIFEITLQQSKSNDARKTAQGGRTKKPRFSKKNIWNVLLATFLVMIFLGAVISTIAFYPQLVSYIERHPEDLSSGTYKIIEIPDDLFDLSAQEEDIATLFLENNQAIDGRETPSTTLKQSVQPEVQEPSSEQSVLSHVEEISFPQVEKMAKHDKKTPVPSKKPSAKPPGDIVVQLRQPGGFSSQEQVPFPTIENNVVLRRHYEQKPSLLRPGSK